MWKVFRSLFFLIILISAQLGWGQIRIQGLLSDENEDPAAGVLVKAFINESIKAYCLSNEKGLYSLAFEGADTIILEYSSLLYTTKYDTLINLSSQSTTIDKTLKFDEKNIESIVVEAKRPITHKGDTTIIQADFYRQGDENKVKDLLKKLPNVDVDEEGKITVGGKKIKHLLIEGDNLLDANYDLVSNNMDQNPIKEIEIINNYHENEYLSTIQNSDNVAINLILDENVKAKVFGTIEAGTSLSSPLKTSRADANILNITKKKKLLLFGNGNNIGFNAISNISSIANDSKKSTIIDKKRYGGINNVSVFTTNALGLSQRRTNLNNEKFGSVILSNKLSKKLSLKGNYTFDNNEYFNRSFTSIQYPNTLYNSTIESTRNHTLNVADINLTYQPKPNSKLTTSVNYFNKNKKEQSTPIFNDQFIVESLNAPSKELDIQIDYTSKINQSTVLEIELNSSDSSMDEEYHTTGNDLQEAFLGSDLNSNSSILQETNSEHSYRSAGFLIHKRKNVHYFGLLGYYYKQKQKRINSISDDNSPFTRIDNSITELLNDELSSKLEYRLEKEKLSFGGDLKIQKTSINNDVKKVNLLPSLKVHYQFNKKDKVSLIYGEKAEAPNIRDLFYGRVIRRYNSVFVPNELNSDLVHSSFYLLNVQKEGWDKNLFTQFTASYTQLKNPFISVYNINENVSTLSRIQGPAQSILNINLKADKFIEPLNLNFGVKSRYVESTPTTIINENIQMNTIGSFINGFDIRTVWVDRPYDITAGFKYINQRVETNNNSQTIKNTFSYLDLFTNFNTHSLALKNELYHFNGQNILLIDFTYNKKIIADKLELNLNFTNLTNQETFKIEQANAISFFRMENAIIPRVLLSGVKWSF